MPPNAADFHLSFMLASSAAVAVHGRAAPLPVSAAVDGVPEGVPDLDFQHVGPGDLSLDVDWEDAGDPKRVELGNVTGIRHGIRQRDWNQARNQATSVESGTESGNVTGIRHGTLSTRAAWQLFKAGTGTNETDVKEKRFENGPTLSADSPGDSQSNGALA
ncbi:hypothetical protein B0H12DRAFT_1080849 [Mycena haematopus]|nr:hypothetical protein B0H12DRAFT_1080849 [Mycena haematopus]